MLASALPRTAICNRLQCDAIARFMEDPSMAERYWLRHPSLSGHLGPYSEADLHAALGSNSFPRDSYVLLDAGQDETSRMASTKWRPMTDLLGLEPPPPSKKPVAPAEPPPPSVAEQARKRVRTASAYDGVRRLIQILAGFALVALAVACVATLFARGLDSTTRLAGLVVLVLEAFAVIVFAAVLQAILDIADCNLRRDA